MVDEDCVVGGEGVDVVGVVHDADVEDGFVGGGGRFSPEGEHQVVGGVDGGVDRREDDGLVGAVGACGGGAVPVETLFAARGVVVGGAVAHIDIGVCGGVGGEVPAGDEVEGVVGSDGYILEVLEVGEGVEVAAFAVGGEAGWGAGVVGRADGAYFEVVEGVGSHAGDEQGVVEGGDGVAVVGDFPLGFLSDGGPGDGEGVAGDRGGMDVGDMGAGGYVVDGDVVDAEIAVVGGGA